MKSPIGIWIVVAISAVLVAACGDESVNPDRAGDANNAEQPAASDVNPAALKEEILEPAVPQEIVGAWTLVAIDGTPVANVGKTPTLIILEDGSASGVGGVNRFHTKIEMQDEHLSIGPAAATKMAGPPEAMRLESTYLARLGAVTAFDVGGETLRLWAGDTEVLVFKRNKD